MSSSESHSRKGIQKCLDGKNIQTKQSRDKKTKEVAQMSFLIWALNRKFSFSFQKPKKRSTVNFCFPDLIEIDFGKDKMNVVQFLNERAEEDYNNFSQRMTPKQANRKVEHLKKVYLHNYLTDLAIHDGITIISKATQKDIEQMERFIRIEFDSNTYDQSEIVEAGVEINVILMAMLGDNSTLNVPKGKLYESYVRTGK
ncbi:hypothetical protein EHI8A_110110 [Entamoeba histolytica HM-1:IMSS-B]|uniref:Uncharacterized protein n=8 Tax=Entamoeba TaxID=5758 RepID=C4LZ85_ENTH1|nr:hypothetical protein ENU1_187800 [Entamoeba nuttalli P19]XP_650589.1 hypothetical protein EHI_104770 [Entamoeba histolytica HM-1:IMSS]EMD43887.1 Hypothetical protein EHI5A_136090 [Entamoeba histolytica KU27]EMH73250.1 hypothetical protein EHI8A_110110 [Entamoeba histolytica HM-1:IMSS-B]EMS16082.1 hypothetical protein KM1_025860 [Entamoeba histolytica HM-3:IMSS]ENY62831.1 hypothetical protein EHI7A_102270 [Entamoeba histolytica HM-1:IMSS-A]GAT94164.1 hypothetical protein CL6EHI_104770 [Enta|eukprot:XP_008859929.1 hypothetical protein ENU1_187800 [Entamoeba nuttalli P19]